MQIPSWSEIYPRLTELQNILEELRRWVDDPHPHRIYVRRENMYFYGHSHHDNYYVHVIDADTAKLFIDFIDEQLRNPVTKLPISPRKIMKLLYMASKPIRPEKTIKLHSYGNRKEYAYKEIDVYKIPPYTVPLIIHKYDRYSIKYSTYVGDYTDYFIPEFKAGELYFGCKPSEIPKVPENIKKLNLPENVIEKIQELLEKGYKIEVVEEREIKLEVGSSDTTAGWWEGRYKVLHGDVEAKTIYVDGESFPTGTGWYRETVKIIPKTDIAVIQYYSWGSLRSWQKKKIYILSK